MCFYPRHPRGWRPAADTARQQGNCFYPRHPRGWRLPAILSQFVKDEVSIHATLAGGDVRIVPDVCFGLCFYPRHPRGWRHVGRHQLDSIPCFYPRHPRGWRRAGKELTLTFSIGFYPRHLRGWRPSNPAMQLTPFLRFYPRHPRGWRQHCGYALPAAGRFLSTPPSRVATSD